MATKKKRINGKLSGLKGDGKPNAYWRRFKERLDSFEQVPVNEWKDEQALAYILKRYKEVIGIEFSLSYSGPPTKCKEIYCIRRTILSLGTEDGEIIKKYIDYVFDTIIVPQKITVFSIAYFFTTNFILNFKKDMRKNNRLTRATKLPEQYISIVSNLGLDVNTYGDLAFAKLVLNDSSNSDEYSEYIELFSQLTNIGFNVNILDTIEG